MSVPQDEIYRRLEEFRRQQGLAPQKSLEEQLEEFRGTSPVEQLEQDPPDAEPTLQDPIVPVVQDPTPRDDPSIPSDIGGFTKQLGSELGRSIGAFALKVMQGVGAPAEFLIPEEQRGGLRRMGDALIEPGMNPIFSKADEIVLDTLKRFAGNAGVKAFEAASVAGEVGPEVLGSLVPLSTGTQTLSLVAQRLIGKRALAVVLGQIGGFGLYEASLSEDLSDVPKNFGYGAVVGAFFGIFGDAAFRMEGAVRNYYRGLKRVQVEAFPNEFRAASKAANTVGDSAGTQVEKTVEKLIGITRREALQKGIGALTAASKGATIGVPTITTTAAGAIAVKLGNVTLRKLGDKVTVIDQFLTDRVTGKIPTGEGFGGVDHPSRDPSAPFGGDKIRADIKAVGGSISSSGEVSFNIQSQGGMERTRNALGNLAFDPGTGKDLKATLDKVEKVLPGTTIVFQNEAKEILTEQITNIVSQEFDESGDFPSEGVIERLATGGFVNQNDLAHSLATVRRDFEQVRRTQAAEQGDVAMQEEALMGVGDLMDTSEAQVSIEGGELGSPEANIQLVEQALGAFKGLQDAFKSFGIENIAEAAGLGTEFDFVKETGARLAREALQLGIPDLARDVRDTVGKETLAEAAKDIEGSEHVLEQLKQPALEVPKAPKDLSPEEFKDMLTERASGLRDQLLAKGETEGLSPQEKLELQFADELLASIGATPEGGVIKLPTLYDTPSAQQNVIPIGEYSVESIPLITGRKKLGIVSQISGEDEAQRIVGEIKDNTGMNAQSLFLPDGSHSVAYFQTRDDGLLSLYKESFSRTLTGTEQLELSKGLGISTSDALTDLSPTQVRPTTRGGFVAEEPSGAQEGLVQFLNQERAIDVLGDVGLKSMAETIPLEGIGSSELRDLVEAGLIKEGMTALEAKTKASKAVLAEARLPAVKKSTPKVIEEEFGIPKEQVIKEKARVPTMLEVKAEAGRRGFEVVAAEDFLLVKDLDGGENVQVNSIREAIEHMRQKEPPADVDLTSFVPDDMKPTNVPPGGGPIGVDQKNNVPPSGIGKIGIYSANVRPTKDVFLASEKQLLKEGYADEGLYDAYRNLNTAFRNITTKMAQVRKSFKPLQKFTEAERELLDISIRNPKAEAPAKIKQAAKIVNGVLRKAEKETGMSLHFYFHQGINDLRTHGTNIDAYDQSIVDSEDFGKIINRTNPFDKDPAAVAYQFVRTAYESLFADEPTKIMRKLARDKRYHQSIRMVMNNHLDDLSGRRDLDTIALQNTMDDFWNKVGAKVEPSLKSNIMDTIMSLNYGANMGFRLGLPLRNLHQTHLVTGKWIGSKYLIEGWRQTLDVRGLLKGKILNQEHFTELMDKGIIFPQQLPVAFTEDVFKTEFEEKIFKINPMKFTQAGLLLYKNADVMNRMITYLGTRQKVLDALERFKDHGDFNKMMGLNETGGRIFEEAIQNRFLKEVGNGNTEDAAHLLATEMEEKTQFIYRRGNSPQAFRGFKGRIFGQYGTWPVYYLEDLKSIMRGGTLTKGERTTVLRRWATANLATQGIWAGFGVDYSRWLWWNPIFFGGGPGYGTFENIIQLTSGTRQQQQYALRGLGIDPGRTIGQIVPGWRGGQDLLEALDSKSAKEAAIDILGLPTPETRRTRTRRGFLDSIFGGRGTRRRPTR